MAAEDESRFGNTTCPNQLRSNESKKKSTRNASVRFGHEAIGLPSASRGATLRFGFVAGGRRPSPSPFGAGGPLGGDQEGEAGIGCGGGGGQRGIGSAGGNWAASA